MTPKSRPLTNTEQQHLADLARNLANLIGSNDGRRALTVLKDMATIGYPHRTSGTPTAFANKVDENGYPIQPDTATETAALNPDKAAAWAGEVFHDLRSTIGTLDRLLIVLGSFAATRHTPSCRECGELLEGGRCRTCPSVEVLCECGKPLKPGDTRDGRCNSCRMHVERNGYVKASMAKYREMTAGILTDDGVYVTD